MQAFSKGCFALAHCSYSGIIVICFMLYLQGFLGVMVAGQILFFFLFKLGKLLRKAIQQAKRQVLVESKEAVN